MAGVALLLSAAPLSADQGSTSAKKPVKSSLHSSNSHHAATPASAHKASHKGKKSRKTLASKRRGQQKIDSARALQIQQALVREHYLTGSPSGVWDDNTQKAMQKFQEDHGWQSKTTPDARALIKLGLGPDHEHLLNPDSAMTTPPESAHSVPNAPPSSPSDPKSNPIPQ